MTTKPWCPLCGGDHSLMEHDEPIESKHEVRGIRDLVTSRTGVTVNEWGLLA